MIQERKERNRRSRTAKQCINALLLLHDHGRGTKIGKFLAEGMHSIGDVAFARRMWIIQ